MPIVVSLRLEFNMLALKGILKVRIFKFKIIDISVRVKHGNIYFTTKKHTIKLKITKQNFPVLFLFESSKLIFFRTNMQSLGASNEIGYLNSAFTNAILVATVDLITKSFFAKIKNHKKSTHIFVETTAQYQKDIFKSILSTKFCISLFDLIYSLLNAVLNLKGRVYGKQKYKSSTINR